MLFSRKHTLATLAGMFILCLASLGSAAHAAPQTLHVSMLTGDDTRSRATAADSGTPLKTINRALFLAQEGDTVQAAPTTVNMPYGRIGISNRKNLTLIGSNGSDGKKAFIRPITTGASRELYSVVSFGGCENITFQGFDVGGTDYLGNKAGPDCNGISITPTTDSATTPCLRIKIKYNAVHDVGGGGIVAGRNGNAPDPLKGNDYIEFTGNDVYRTNSTGQNNSSALSLLLSINSDNDTTRVVKWHNVIQRNYIHDNLNVNPNTALHTDCNGIIIDTSKPNVPWTLIQNNVIFKNGGRGIHIFLSNNVDVLNNTCYQNVQDPVYFSDPDIRRLPGTGEITVIGYNGVNIKNVNVYNNICYSRPATSTTAAVNNYVVLNYGFVTSPTTFTTYPIETSVKLDYNSSYGQWSFSFNADRFNVPPANVGNLKKPLVLFPDFMNIGAGNFSLKQNAATWNKGTTVSGRYATGTFDGLTRNVTDGIDLGAYEH